MLLRQPTEKAGDLCRPLITAEVTVCICHYMDMCPVVAQRTPLIDFIYFAIEELPSNNYILLLTLSYKQDNKLGNRVSVTSSSDFWCCPCPLPKVSVMKNPRDAETHSGKNISQDPMKAFQLSQRRAGIRTSHSCKEHSAACRKSGDIGYRLVQPFPALQAQHHKPA